MEKLPFCKKNSRFYFIVSTKMVLTTLSIRKNMQIGFGNVQLKSVILKYKGELTNHLVNISFSFFQPNSFS